MKTLTIRHIIQVRKVVLILLAMTIGIYVVFKLFDLRDIASNSGIMYVLVICGGIPTLALLIFKKLYTKTFEIELTDKTISVKENGSSIIKMPAKELSMMTYNMKNGANPKLELYKGNNLLLSLLSSTDEKKFDSIQDVVDAIVENGNFITANEKSVEGKLGSYSVEYINKDFTSSPNFVEDIRNQGKKKKTKKTLIIAFVLIAVVAMSLLPFFINPKAFYEKENDKVYFGSKEMAGINSKEFTTISYNVAKDSSKIYFRGEEVDVDYKTFKVLKMHLFYHDKNRIYYETNSLYTKKKLAILDGDFDLNTFENIDNTLLFRDKNHLYKLNIWTLDIDKYVTPGLNVSKLQAIEYSSFWMKDDKTIYFEDFGKLTPRPDLDYESFEALSYYVVKDKNKVLYMAKDIKTEGQSAKDNFEYLELKGAHAPTFKMINDKSYVDKNTTWRITKEGQKINYRNGVE